MTHYPSAKAVRGAMADLRDVGEYTPGEGYDFGGRTVEVRTKEHGTQEFEVVDLAMGQMNTLTLERNGVGVIVEVNLSPRGKYTRPAKMRRADVDYAEAERAQVMEVTL